MFSGRSAQSVNDGPYWYHFLPISIFLHLVIFALCCFGIPENMAWQVFAVQVQEERQIVPFREAVIDVFETSAEPEIEEAVSPDADPFEENPIEFVPPEIVFHTPEDSKSEEQPVNESEIPEKIEIPDKPEISSEKTPELPVVATENVPSAPSESSEISGKGENSGLQGMPAGSIMAHETAQNSGTKVIKIESPQPQVDENVLWQQYTKLLSEHFKKHRHYPEMARKRHLTGTVWLLVEVRRDGSLISVEIAESSGVPMLDNAAVSSAKKSVPVPPFPKNTSAETKKIRIPYAFKLK